MAIKAPIELYRRSIPEGLKTKDLFFVALQERLAVIKPKELNKNEIKIVGYVDVEQGDFTGIQKNCIYLGKGNDRIPFDVYNKNSLKIVGYIPVEGENAYIAVVKPMSPVFVILLENYFSRKGKRSQRRKNAFRAQRHRRDVMAEKFDTESKNDGILRKTYKDGYAKFESSHGRVKKEDKSNSYHCKHPRERRRIEAANSKLADYMQSDICLDLYDSVFDDDDDYDTYMGQLFYDNLVYFLCEESGWSEEDLQGIGIVEMMDIAYELGAGEKLGINKRTFAVPCNVRAYDGHISVEWMYDRLSSKAKKLLAVCRSYIYDDNTDWDYSLDFNC